MECELLSVSSDELSDQTFPTMNTIVRFFTFSANASPTSLASPVKLLEIITALRPRLSVFDAIFPRAGWLFPTIISNFSKVLHSILLSVSCALF